MGALAILLIVLVAAAVAIVIMAGATHEDSHEARVARMEVKHKESVRQIDETGEYYTGLYSYIAGRLDDESRRRQSG